MPTYEIEELTKHFVEQLLPVRIYLFGSYANNTYTEESDLDFYLIVATKSRFEARKGIPSVENEVYRKGVLLYDSGDERVV